MALDRIMVGGRTAASIALLVWIEIRTVGIPRSRKEIGPADGTGTAAGQASQQESGQVGEDKGKS